MTVLDVHWCIGHQKLRGLYFQKLQTRGEKIHIKTIGTLEITPDTSVGDIEKTVAGCWVMGKIVAPPEVRQALRDRRRWKPQQEARRDRTVRLSHTQATTDGLTTDRSVGLAWFDRYELEKCIEIHERIDISVLGCLAFAPDVTPDLVFRVFDRIELRGFLAGPPAVRAAARQVVAR